MKKDNEIESNIKSKIGKVFNALKNINNRNKAIGILSLFVLCVSLTIFSTENSFADINGDGHQWGGSAVDTTTYAKNDERGFYTGYFYINTYKNSTRFATVTIQATAKTQKGNATRTQRDYNLNSEGKGRQQFQFTCTTCDNSKIVVTSGGYTANNKMFNGNCSASGCNYYPYISAPVKILIPKGYKYSESKTGYSTYYFTSPAQLGLYNSNTASSSNKSLFDASVGKRGPYASDTWVSGYVNVSEWAMGAITNEGNVTGHEREVRHFESYSVRFVPNTTKITYNANGGSGAPASQTKTYDSTLTLSSTLPTKSGYQFVKWCTAKNGTGTCYNASQVLDKQIWPATTSVTLYAQYKSIDTKCEDYQGYTYNISSASQELGYNSGYFCLHLAKNGTVYSSDKVTITPKTTGTNGSTALRTTHLCAGASSCAQRWMFSNSDDSNIKVGTSSTTEYAGNKIAATGIAYSVYGYVYPTLSIKIPKGYKYGTTNLGGLIGYDSTLHSPAYELGVRLTGSPIEGTALTPLFSDLSNRGPFAEDTWINKYISVNIYSSGLVSVKALNNSYYGIHESNNFNFIPNETTVHYNANGGTMEDEESDTMEDSIHSYDEESYISNNLYSKDGYVFKEWNTKKDGSGKRYVPNEEITTEFPTESEITLYAQWIPKYKATIYHTAKNAENETVIESEVLECIPLANKDYRIYAFHNTTSNEDYVYVTDTSGNVVSNLPLTIYTEEDDEIGHGVTDDDGKLRIDTFEDFSNNIDDVWAAVDEPYGDGVAVTLFPTNSGDSFSTSGNYKTFHGKGEKLATSCTVEIPSEVTSSKGTYNNSYAGLADRPGTVNISIDPSTTTITLTENKTYYSVYNSPVINYYYND